MNQEQILEIARRHDPDEPDFVMTTDTLIAFAQSLLEESQAQLDKYRLLVEKLDYQAAKYQELIAAAEAVIDRWNTPLWKDAEQTAAVIYRMRDAIQRLKEDP